MLNEKIRKLYALSKLKGVGPSTLIELSKLSNFEAATLTEIGHLNRRVAKAIQDDSAWDLALSAVEHDLTQAKELGARIICPLDTEYPQLLLATPDRPFFLYVRGQWHSSPNRSVAVIGTRNPTDHGTMTAGRITQFLVEDGWSIVSGLALGCDATAHREALAAGGHTVAVLAHGLQTVAPKQHERLAGEILEKGGALVTEYGFGIDAIPHQFVKRDRIQAGLSKGVVMVQSDKEGGSLHASRAAIEYGRLLAVPYPTERDINSKESKIEANLLLAGVNAKDKMTLLKCDDSDLDYLFILRGKSDYPLLSKRLSEVIANPI